MISLSSDVYFISRSKSNATFQRIQTKEIYRIKNTTFFQNVEIPSRVIFLVEILRKAFRRQNFSQVPIRGAIVV